MAKGVEDHLPLHDVLHASTVTGTGLVDHDLLTADTHRQQSRTGRGSAAASASGSCNRWMGGWVATRSTVLNSEILEAGGRA